MNNEEQLIELVKDFLAFAEKLLKDGRIDYNTYEKITFNKKDFLNKRQNGGCN